MLQTLLDHVRHSAVFNIIVSIVNECAAPPLCQAFSFNYNMRILGPSSKSENLHISPHLRRHPDSFLIITTHLSILLPSDYTYSFIHSTYWPNEVSLCFSRLLRPVPSSSPSGQCSAPRPLRPVALTVPPWSYHWPLSCNLLPKQAPLPSHLPPTCLWQPSQLLPPLQERSHSAHPSRLSLPQALQLPSPASVPANSAITTFPGRV